MNLNSAIIPDHSSSDVKGKYWDKQSEWKLFAYGCGKNPFVVEYLLDRYGCVCAYCGKAFQENQRVMVHHCSYDNYCAFPDIVLQPRPTVNRPNRARKTPNCKKCSLEHNDWFEVCMSHLRPVHSYCNKLIDDVSKKCATSEKDSISSLGDG